ncbi:MAG: 2-amino-4-hydroxy-6-hydroxymethyldihydropteridine diphosphokinase [Myxococcales bacterium]|nr:2-amino-4-hydroxy-6-hydroxymethyldihydropteridine diphosphokinase [Myxococcales bacterium]
MSGSPETAIVIALGGNLGGQEAVASRFVAVLESMSEAWGVALVSSNYVTAPVGPIQDQPDFLNAVAAFWPAKSPSPEAALTILQGLENDFGRERIHPGGSRTLDLDLLLLAGERRDESGLHLPHPRMKERAFVLQPLAELFGDAFQWDPEIASVGTLLADDEAVAQACRRLGVSVR